MLPYTLHQPFTPIIISISVLISNSNSFARSNFKHLLFSTTPPWSFPAPIINYTLAQHSKASTPSSVSRSHFQELIHSFNHPILCFTDGSKSHNRTGFAYPVQNCTYLHRHRNTASAYTTELHAINHCIANIFYHPQPP